MKPREFWILEYPGLGSEHRNYGVKFENGPYETMCRNGALINYWHVTEFAAAEKLAMALERAMANAGIPDETTACLTVIDTCKKALAEFKGEE